MATKNDETQPRYDTVESRTINHEGRIGYTWRFFPNEAEELDRIIAKAGYTDRTSWFREQVLKLPPLVRKTKKPAKAKKAAKKADRKGSKKASKKEAPPATPRKSAADIGPPA